MVYMIHSLQLYTYCLSNKNLLQLAICSLNLESFFNIVHCQVVYRAWLAGLLADRRTC